MTPSGSGRPRHVVLMGVAGSGKSTVAMGLARELDWEFGEADEFHPAANVAKMAAGHPLTDEDRWPWLYALAAWIAERDAAGISTVLACSALRRAYRDILREGAPTVIFIHLHGPQEVIAERMARRLDHFMPTSLLDSQYATLEEIEPDEPGHVLDVRLSPIELVAESATIVASLS